MASRNYPNDYFAWFNDDQRLAILTLDTTSTDTSERTTERYDTFQGTGNLSGTITDLDGDSSTATATSASHGLSTNDRYIMIPKLADPHKLLRSDTDASNEALK